MTDKQLFDEIESLGIDRIVANHTLTREELEMAVQHFRKERESRVFDMEVGDGEICEYDVYCTACPHCGAIQGGNDWRPYPKERFTCERCGKEYDGIDLMTDHCGIGVKRRGDELTENGYPLTQLTYYTYCCMDYGYDKEKL